MLRSFDGIVFYREWACDEPKAVMILVHGLGGHSGRFHELGPLLSKAGYYVYAIELKGHGESPSIKGHINNFKIYTADMRSLVEFARIKHTGKKIFILGESMGGLISLDFTIHHQDLLDGLILISPALKDKMAIPLNVRAEIFREAIFDPMGFFPAGFSASLFTRDPAVIKKIDSDPIEVRNFTARFFLSILKTMLFVSMMPRKITLPVLMLLAGQDKMISSESAEKYFKKIPSKDKEIKQYPEMYHALYIDKGREKVFADIVDWINKRS